MCCRRQPRAGDFLQDKYSTRRPSNDRKTSDICGRRLFSGALSCQRIAERRQQTNEAIFQPQKTGISEPLLADGRSASQRGTRPLMLRFCVRPLFASQFLYQSKHTKNSPGWDCPYQPTSEVHSDIVQKLSKQLHDWQDSVLNSLMDRDYGDTDTQ